MGKYQTIKLKTAMSCAGAFVVSVTNLSYFVTRSYPTGDLKSSRGGNTDRVPGHLDDDVCKQEGLPGVGFRRLFSSFVKRSLLHKRRHHLVDKLTEDSEKQEYAKHLVLQASYCVLAVQDGKTDEQSLSTSDFRFISSPLNLLSRLTVPTDKRNFAKMYCGLRQTCSKTRFVTSKS